MPVLCHPLGAQSHSHAQQSPVPHEQSALLLAICHFGDPFSRPGCDYGARAATEAWVRARHAQAAQHKAGSVPSICLAPDALARPCWHSHHWGAAGGAPWPQGSSQRASASSGLLFPLLG